MEGWANRWLTLNPISVGWKQVVYYQTIHLHRRSRHLECGVIRRHERSDQLLEISKFEQEQLLVEA